MKWKAERGRVNDDNSIVSVKLPDVSNRLIGIESCGDIEFQGCYTKLGSSCLSQLSFSFDCYMVVEYMQKRCGVQTSRRNKIAMIAMRAWSTREVTSEYTRLPQPLEVGKPVQSDFMMKISQTRLCELHREDGPAQSWPHH